MFAVIVILLFSLWFVYYKYCFTYWNKKGIPTVPPSFPAGNITSPVLGQENLFVTFQNIYRKYKNRGEKHVGIYFFNGAIYFPIDLELIKSILVTDFEHFVDRGSSIDGDKYPLAANVFIKTGAEWRSVRRKLTPVYTSGKIKNMFEFMNNISSNLLDRLDPFATRGEEINIKKISQCFTGDLICTTAFGININLTKNPEQELSYALASVLDPSLWQLLSCVILEGFQNPVDLIKAIFSNPTNENFFKKFVDDIIKFADENKLHGNNLFLSLLEMKNKGELSYNRLIGESFLFFMAGYETSSSAISFCIHELAHNQEIQEKLRKEIYNNLGNHYTKFTYDGIMNLPYLDQVFHETLRKYPTIGALNRVCVKPYRIPGTDITLEKGTPVFISALGLNRDPEYFPDPLKFDPERFADNNRPAAFMPFGLGPRHCIGARLGKLQSKVGIAVLVTHYRFSPSSVTPREIEFDKICKSPVLCPKEGLTVRIEKI